MVQEQRKAGVGAGRPASGPEDEGARAMRAAIDQQLRQTFAVASASVGQNLVFGSNGFEWVTPLPTAGLVANAVTNAKLAQMATSTFKGRNSGGTGDPEDMTVAQVLAKLGCPYVVASEAGNPVRTIGVSSAAEQTLCSLTVPAGALGTAGKCVLELVGDITNNSGGSNNYQLKIKFGATTVYDKTSSFATGTQPRPLVIRVHLCALGATNLQRLTTELYHGYLLTATVGNGDWGDFNGRAFTMQGSAAEDSTAAKALAVTVQNSVSNANINWRLYSAKLVCYP